MVSLLWQLSTDHSLTSPLQAPVARVTPSGANSHAALGRSSAISLLWFVTCRKQRGCGYAYIHASPCWHPELGWDMPSRYQALASTPVKSLLLLLLSLLSLLCLTLLRSNRRATDSLRRSEHGLLALSVTIGHAYGWKIQTVTVQMNARKDFA